jgi:competence protein ComEC
VTPWLHAVRRHPRHVVLFAAVAGLLLGPLWPPGVLGAALLAGAVAGARGLALLAAAAVLAGAVVADARLSALDAGSLASLHGRHWQGDAVLLEPVRERARGPAVARVRLPALAEGAVARVPRATHRGAWPDVGAVVTLSGRIGPLGRYDAYQRRRGAHAAIDVDRFDPTGRRRGGVAGALDAIRRRAERGLQRGLPPPEAALLRGMVLGQDERLGEAVRTDFQRSGLAHLLAVSGQNVVLLATLVLGLGTLAGLDLRARLGAALLLVALYVPLAGGGPSIQRAGVMGGAGLVAALAGRPSSRWYALGLAAAVTLALNPRAAGEPGWQLSFAAVAGLLALVPRLRAALRRHRIPGPLADASAVTVAATLATAPLMAFHFEQVSLASLPANLLAAPAVAPVMWLGMLAAAAAQVSPMVCAPLNAVNGCLLAFVEWVAHVAAAPTAATMHARIGGAAGLALVYLVAAVLGLAARAAWRRCPRGRGRRGAIAGAALGLAGLLAVALLVRGGAGLSQAPLPGELVVSFERATLDRGPETGMSHGNVVGRGKSRSAGWGPGGRRFKSCLPD